ncbi:MAG: hypothetical protein IJN84_04025 [Clostridia bacterium]|nr:hypothetical protein [Clostridia bacterium]
MKKRIIFLASLAVLAASVICLLVNIVRILPPISEIFKSDEKLSTESTKEVTEAEAGEIKLAFENGDYDEVIRLAGEAIALTNEEKDIVCNILDEREADLQNKVSALVKEYKYSQAKEIIADFTQKMPTNGVWNVSEYTNKLNEMCEKYSNLVEYKGDIEHIFFHPLIAYKELAFDGDYQEKGLDDYFTTIPEFKEVIRQLYENDYVLIDIHLIYNVNEDGTVSKNTLMLPEGKKPIVISIDDLNFYDYMKEHGMAHGFMIQDDKIVTYSDRPDGTRDISDDNAIVPILEKFVNEHPDFSFGGARGIIASTGYNGTLGFPTDDLESPDYEENFSKAKEIADKLKEMGWLFASHSYGHGWASNQSLEKIKWDNDTWLREVVPIVGETDIYIFPYGEIIKPDDPKHQYMVDNGFKMFCGVQSKSAYLRFYDESVLMQRRNIDGISMKSGNVGNLFDISKILDPDRPDYD